MAGCWVALLFSLVDPYLWIFSSGHRHIHATDSAQKAIQGSIREDPRVSAARCCWVAWAALLFSLVDPHLWIFSSRHRQSLEVIPDVEGRATRSKGHRQDKRKEGVSMHRGQRVARP